MSRVPLEAVASGGIVIRRWQREDAEALSEMIAASVDHLRPWMPWVQNEPLSLGERAEKIAGWGRDWDAAAGFTFAMTDSTSELVGMCGLRKSTETPDVLEVGYWVRSERTGEGIATDAVRALIEAGFSIDGIAHLTLRHDAANTASARVAQKAGFVRLSERTVTPSAPGEVGVDVTWRLSKGVTS